MLEQYLIPLAPWVFTALGCIFALFLVVSFEKEIQRLKHRFRRPAAADSLAQDLKSKIEQLSDRIRDAEERAGIMAAAPSPRASLNLNKRTQVLRLWRRGERPENIAASLSLPRREVELLLKIHSLVLSGPTESSSLN